MEDPMKRIGLFFGVAVLLFAAAAIPARAQSHELLQGTEVHLRLLTALSTAVAKSGDPFIAQVAEPVYIGSEMILPAGARAKGTLGGVLHRQRFPIFRRRRLMRLF